MKEKEPLISVIVPVYNVEKYLKRCLDSVINQTYKNLEIILVDDGSTDSSGKMCDEYAKEDDRVKVIHKKNGGLSSARNIGMEKANGEYACFVDSDDDVLSNYIRFLYGLIKKYDVEMSIACYSVVTASGKRIFSQKKYTEEELGRKDALRALLMEDIFTVSANSKMYSRRLYKMIRFPEGKICEDNGATYKFIINANGIAFGNKSIYNYYKNSGSIMLGEFNVKKLDLIELVDKMCKDIVQEYGELDEVALRRRILARFSILRQMDMKKPNTNEKQIIKRMKKFIFSHKREIMTQPIYSSRDRIALLILLFGRNFYNYAWAKYYKKRYA